MGSRIREQPDRLFTLFAEVVAPENGADGWILQKFPDEFEDQGVLKNVPLFCFPTGTTAAGPVQHFCFVLTDVDSMFTFGFCRLNTDGKTCLCILSSLPWHDVFYKLLNYIVDLMTKHVSDDLIGFLRTTYGTDVPGNGEELHIIHRLQKVEFQSWSPDSKRLPSIPENRVVTEYFNALDVNNMITIFASLLNERRVLITSKKLGRLTACVMACNILLYPMRWQHIFVPVLPKKLLEYVTAPMPFIIGVPSELMPAVLNMDIGEVVIVDADLNSVQTPFDDAQIMPSSVVASIRSGAGKMFGDGVARSFMRALVELIGGYRFGLSLPAGEKISFDMDKFIRNRPAHLQLILSKLTDQQIFRQFIDERLDLLNKGIGFSDEFEQEVSLLIDHESGSNRDASIADQYHRWSSKGGDIFRIMTNKVKDRSRGAVKGLRNKMQDRSSRMSQISTASDRFGGSEPALSLPAPGGSPPHNRLYAVKLPPGNNNRSSVISRDSLDRNFDSRSLESDFVQNAGLTVDLPQPRTSQLIPEPKPIVPVKEDALISFDDAANDSVDTFLDPSFGAGDTTPTANRQSFAHTLNSLYAVKTSPNPGSLPVNGSLHLASMRSPPGFPPPLHQLRATSSLPVWDTRSHPVSPQPQVRYTIPPTFVNGNSRPVLDVAALRPIPAPRTKSNTVLPADLARQLEQQLLGDPTGQQEKSWENFG